MQMEIKLLINNLSSIFTALVTLLTGIFVWRKGPRRVDNKLFFLFSLSGSIFFLSHIIGVNLSDPMASRNVFMFNMVTIFLAVFTLHWVSALLKRLEKEKKILTIMYLMACLLSLFFIIFPDFFMLASAPKAYFPNFYVPGKYYFLGDIIFYVTILYTFFRMFQSYKTADFILKKRIRYVFIGLVGALVFSSLPAFLLYGIPVDPLFSFFGGFFYIIMGYGLVKENFLNINLVAKKTFFYTILVGLLGIIIAGADYLNSYLINQNVNFPRWLMPL